MKRAFPLFALLGVLFVLLGSAPPARAQGPVVRAVLFYSPTCAHCHQVITGDLPPLLEKYGQQLSIIGVSTANAEGRALYVAAIEKWNIPEDRRGVPMLLVGDVVLVGGLEIPQQFPLLIEQYLAQGGIDWPAIPGLVEALAAGQPGPSPRPTQPAPAAGSAPTAIAVPSTLPVDLAPGGPAEETVADRLARDPVGNGLSIAVLAGMVAAVVLTAVKPRRPAGPRRLSPWRDCLVPLLSVIGLGVAGYLAYVETTHVAAVCGPVGDCNTVQQSAYARLFGIIPIAVLGVAGYVAIGSAWLVAFWARGRLAGLIRLGLFAMALFGTLFSIYLTFLEPFVIGATCAWCLTSAVLMTALMLLAAGPAREALADLKADAGPVMAGPLPETDSEH